MYGLPSAATILTVFLVLVLAFIVSFTTVSFSLSVSFKSAALRARLAVGLSQLTALICGLASFHRLTAYTSELVIFRSELVSFHSELAALTSEIANLQREWLDLTARNRNLEREVTKLSAWMGRSKTPPQDTGSPTSVRQEAASQAEQDSLPPEG